MAALASDLLRHFFLLLWNYWMEFNENWQEAWSQSPLPSCFSGWSEKQNGRPGLWLAKTFLTFPLIPLNGIQQNLKQDRKQDLNVLYQVCVFSADRKNRMVALASDWLRHFRLLLWNRWKEFDETWLKQVSISSSKFVFFGPISKQKGQPWPISQKSGTLCSIARNVALWASCIIEGLSKWACIFLPPYTLQFTHNEQLINFHGIQNLLHNDDIKWRTITKHTCAFTYTVVYLTSVSTRIIFTAINAVYSSKTWQIWESFKFWWCNYLNSEASQKLQTIRIHQNWR